MIDQQVIGNIVIALITAATAVYVRHVTRRRPKVDVEKRLYMLEKYVDRLRKSIIDNGGTPPDWPRELTHTRYQEREYEDE